MKLYAIALICFSVGVFFFSEDIVQKYVPVSCYKNWRFNFMKSIDL